MSEKELKSINKYSVDFLLKNLEKCIFISDFKNAVYIAIEMDLFFLYENGENIRFNLFIKLITIYMKYTHNPYIFETLNHFLKELDNLKTSKKSEKDIFKTRKREIEIISNFVNMLCSSYKSMDNEYYKFCLYDFNFLNKKEKNILKEKFFFLEDIDYLEYSEYIEYIPSSYPEYIITLPNNLKILCKKFIGSFEQKNDISIYFAHKLAKDNSIELLFDLINFVLVNEKSEYAKYIEIAKKWYKILLEEDKYLCWQTIIIFFLKNKIPNLYIEELNKDLIQELSLRNMYFKKLNLNFSINIEEISEEYSNLNYKNVFLYYKNYKNYKNVINTDENKVSILNYE